MTGTLSGARLSWLRRASVAARSGCIRLVSGPWPVGLPRELKHLARIVVVPCDVVAVGQPASPFGNEIGADGRPAPLQVPAHVHAAANGGFDDPVPQKLHVRLPRTSAHALSEVRRVFPRDATYDVIAVAGGAVAPASGWRVWGRRRFGSCRAGDELRR